MAGSVIALTAGWVGLNSYAAVVIARGGDAPAERRDPASVGLAFTNVSYGEGLAAWHVRGQPGRPVIIVVHGYGNNRSATLEVGPPLHALGYGLLFVNLGYVSGDRPYGGGQREAADISRAVSWVNDTVRAPVVLLGFSGGAFAALSSVAGGSQVTAVISDSGFAGFRDVVAFRAHVSRAFTSLLPVLYPLVSDGGHAIDLSRRVGGRRFPAPVLVVQGTADRTISPSSGAKVARLTQGELWVLPGVGHAGAFHYDESEYVSRVDAFIHAAQSRAS